jgi:hypothetical protein
VRPHRVELRDELAGVHAVRAEGRPIGGAGSPCRRGLDLELDGNFLLGHD